MNKIGKVVKKLVAGEFNELGDRAREELIRRRERKHYAKQADLFAPDAFPLIFSDSFRNKYSRSDGSLDLAAAIKAKPTERFYPGFAHSAEFVASIAADKKKRILETADRVVANEFPIFSLGYLSYDDPPRWNFDPVHNKTASDGFYADIDYLNFATCGDVKVTWELSRFQFVYDLGQAYTLTGDGRYASKFVDLIGAWSEAHPDFRGVTFCSALEFAFRINSLCWGICFFKDTDAIDTRHARNIYRLIYISASFLRDHLSTWFSPNTHLFGEAYGLYMTGVLFPEFTEAKSWEETGLAILREELDKQITSDGMHAELSTAYHAYLLEFVLATVQLAHTNDRELPQIFYQKLQALVDLFASIQRPDGTWPHIGDEDGGRLFWLSRKSAGDYCPILEAARQALLSEKRDDLSGEYSESFWLTGTRLGPHKQETDRIVADDAGTLIRTYPEAGLFVCKSSCKQMYSLFQCGRFGYNDCPHSHADMLHVDLSMGSDNFTIDPGTYIYTADLVARNRYRSAAMHNGPHLPGIEYYNESNPFGWLQRPDIEIKRATNGNAFGYCKARYEAESTRTGKAKISRALFFLADRMWIVHDSIRLEKSNDAAWRFVTPCDAELTDRGVLLKGSQSDLLIIPVVEDDKRLAIEVNPCKFSTDYLEQQQGAEIAVNLTESDGHILFWLVMPYTQDMQTASDIQVCTDNDSSSLSFWNADGRHHLSIGSPVRRSSRDLTTDAAFAYALFKNDECQRAIIAGGSLLELNGKIVVKSKSPSEYVDLIREGDKYRVDSSSDAALITPLADSRR